MNQGNLHVLVLEDNAAIAMRFKQIFDTWPKAKQVDICSTLQQAIQTINQQTIDLLVVDLNLPDGSGVDAIRLLDTMQPNAVSVVISALSQRQVVIDAIQAGAVGYLLKDDDSIDILNACEHVLSGQSMMSGTIARLMVEMVKGKSTQTTKHSPLTQREEEVLRAIAHGYSYREVASLLKLSEHTVPVHIRNIYRKLKVNNRTQATYEARLMGVLTG